MVLSAISSLPHRPLECPQCHWQDWIRTVLQETSRLGECLGCSRPSRWWWSDMGVVAGRRGGGCDEGPHSWCATDAHYAAFCSPFLNLHKCFLHLHSSFLHISIYLYFTQIFVLIIHLVCFPHRHKSLVKSSHIQWNCQIKSKYILQMIVLSKIPALPQCACSLPVFLNISLEVVNLVLEIFKSSLPVFRTSL